jgi:hypothetical protein
MVVFLIVLSLVVLVLTDLFRWGVVPEFLSPKVMMDLVQVRCCLVFGSFVLGVGQVCSVLLVCSFRLLLDFCQGLFCFSIEFVPVFKPL